jgi:hypothetical protein
MTKKNKSPDALKFRAFNQRAHALQARPETAAKKPVNFPISILLLGGLWGFWFFEKYRNHQPGQPLINWSGWRHPSGYTLMSWGILAAGGGFWLFLYVSLAHKKKRMARAKADWFRAVDAAVDRQDFAGHDHLYECLEPAGREQLIRALERQPRGSRSLTQAVKIVDPELIELLNETPA